MFEQEKNYININLEIQQNLKNTILIYMKNFANSTTSIDIKFTDNIVDFLNNLKTSLNYCNTNISELEKLNKELDSATNIEEIKGLLNTSLINISSNTLSIQKSLATIEPHLDLVFGKSIPSQSKTDNIVSNSENIAVPDEIKNNENTLIISDMKDKVILPYYICDLEKLKSSNQDLSYQDIINKFYTLPLSQFKNAAISRFREAFKLVKDKDKSSIRQAFDLGMELFFNYNLHPAIIAGCRSQDELDIYLDYLDTNETEKFNCFKIIFEIAPTIVK